MTYTNELYHFGVKGMRWGVRRYQNADGTRTSAGKRRERQSAQTRKGLSPKAKRAIKIGAAIGVTALAAYGATRLVKSEQGQKLVNELLNKGGKTLINAGKTRLDDPRMIKPTVSNRKSMSELDRLQRLAPTSKGRARVQEQLDRDARYEKKHTKATTRTDKMRDTIRRAENIRVDTYLDEYDRYNKRLAEQVAAFDREQKARREKTSRLRPNSVFDSDDEYANELFRRNNKRLGL